MIAPNMFSTTFLVVALACCPLHIVAYPTDTLDYMPYYQAMNRAEQCVARLRLKSALHIYDSTFRLYPKRRRCDIYNASLCALHCEQPAKAQEWLMYGIMRGLSMNELNKTTFNQQPSEFWRPIEQHYDSLRAIYRAAADSWHWFKALCDTMHEREQYAINELPIWGYDSMRYAHAQRLYRIIDSIGVPPVPMFYNESETLPSAVFLHNFKLRNSLLYGHDVDTTATPYRNMDMRRYDLEPLLLKAVHSGDIDPEEIYYFAKSDNGGIKETVGVYGVTPYGGYIDYQKKDITCELLDFVDIDRVNAERKKYGLPSIEDVMQASYELVLFYNPKSYPFDEMLQALIDNNCYSSVYARCKNSRERAAHNSRCNSAKRTVMKKHREQVLRNITLTIPQELPNHQYNTLQIIEFKLPNWRQVYSLWEIMNINDTDVKTANPE